MSYRVQHKFWLDLDKPDETEVNETIHSLKQGRSFTATIRDGIRLICDLRAGRLDVLMELFPWIQGAVIDTLTPAPSGDDPELQRQLARIEQLLLAENNGQVVTPVAGQACPRPLSVPKKNIDTVKNYLPEDDDLPALTVVKSKTTGKKDSAAAFVDQCFSFVRQ